MHISKVYFEKIYPTSSYLNERCGIEFILNSGENAKYALDEARKLMDEWQKEQHPELYKHNETHLTVEETSIIAEIQSAPTLERLAQYKNSLTQATKKYYLDKLKELSVPKK